MDHRTRESASAVIGQEATENASSKMRTWGVTVPVAGHAYIVVDALDEESAIDTAMENIQLQHLDSWEAVHRFQQGNVSYCPHPWEAEAVDETPDED